MTGQNEVACQLLKLEQQLKAYQKLHTGELAELWRTLDECKQQIATWQLKKEDSRPTTLRTPPVLESDRQIIEPRKGD